MTDTPTICNVCGEEIATTPGTFILPDGVQGVCCGICGPKIQTFAEGESLDIDSLPDGPLKAFLMERATIAAALGLFEIIHWLQMRRGILDFSSGEYVEAECFDADGERRLRSRAPDMVKALRALWESSAVEKAEEPQ